MLSEDDFNYAIESTQVILAPERRIESFGQTSFRFYLISELMDSVDQVRIRDGRLHAERPQILMPGHFHKLLLDGFGEKARDFADWLEHHNERLPVLMKYGFQFRKTDVTEQLIHSPVESVIERVRRDVSRDDDEAISAIIQGVDEGWEICLLKFAVDLVQKSAGGNFGDFRKRGLL